MDEGIDGFSPASRPTSLCATISSRCLSAAVTFDELAGVAEFSSLSGFLRDLGAAADTLSEALTRTHAAVVSEAVWGVLSATLESCAQATATVEKKAKVINSDIASQSIGAGVIAGYEGWAVLAIYAIRLLSKLIQTPTHAEQESMLGTSSARQTLQETERASRKLSQSSAHLLNVDNVDNDANHPPGYTDNASGYPRDVKGPAPDDYQPAPVSVTSSSPQAAAIPKLSSPSSSAEPSQPKSGPLASLSEAFRAMTAPFRYKPEPLVVALCEASARGDVAHIAMLITSGANVDGRDEKGKTPIARAIENQQYDAVKRLLNHGASKGVTDTAKRSPPLFWATAAGDLQMVKLLLDHGCSPVDKDLYGSPYFCETVTQGNVEIVQLLLDYGANVNARDAWGREVLLHAYQKGNLEMMQLLQSRGASVNVKDKTGSPIIVLALQEGKMDIFHFLLARGADVNSRSITGTPLTVEALQKKRHDVFKLLLQRGADPNASNITGTPLLMMIVKDDTGYSLTQKYDLVHSLLSRGANPNICDSWGRTLMSHVVEKGCVELIQPLLEKGADPNQKTTAAGDTLLLYAIDQRRSDLIPVLLGHSANPNAADAKGRTPLVQALRKRDFATARLLLERGADANKDGAISPLAFASALGDGDTVRLLRNYGARGDDVDVLVAPKTSQAAPPIPQASAPLEDTDVVDEPPPGYDGVSKRT